MRDILGGSLIVADDKKEFSPLAGDWARDAGRVELGEMCLDAAGD